MLLTEADEVLARDRLDLNQRPLGYEGKSSLNTDQREPAGTNYDGDLGGDKADPCWFVSVG